MIYGQHRMKGAPLLGADAAGGYGPFGPDWTADSEEGQQDSLDPTADVYTAHVRHLEHCRDCGPTRCPEGQALVDAYLEEVRRR
ncbi:hypothetical protein [Streptomyces sp. NPDC003487]